MDLPGLSIRRPIFILCIVSLMLIIGFTSLKKMPVDQFPDITFPIVSVIVNYPGATPVDLEKQVSKPIEDELGSLSGLKTLTSSNLDSIAQIILEFRLGTDIKDAEQQIRNRIGNIRKNLPTDIEEPVIRRMDPADQPVVVLAMSSDLPDGKAFDIANEIIKPQFERLNDVGQVDIVGGRKTEIHVLIDKTKLQDRKISMIQVAGRVAETSKDVPIGKVDDAKIENTMRTMGEFKSLADLAKVNVNFLGSDRPVRISDIGEVVTSLEDEKTRGSLNGKKTLLLQVYKQSGANTVAVSEAVKKNIEKVNQFLSEKKLAVHVDMVRDLAFAIHANVEDVKQSILIGIALCILVVFFFLGSVRSTFITAMALPNSLLGGFVIMAIMGFTINIMTLLALSLAVGLLIDDAIVVRENIFRHMQLGKKPKDAALEGTKEVAQAVIATTLVVIAVFGPISFVDGIVGQFFRQFGLTVVFTMLISLFDAFTVAPMLSAYMASPQDHAKSESWIGRILSLFDRFQSGLENLYEKILRWALRRRKTVLLLATVVFFSCMSLVILIPKTFLPANDAGEFQVNIETPTGTSLEGTSVIANQIEAELHKSSFVQLLLTTVGNATNEANKASIYVHLVPRNQRDMNTSGAKTRVREAIAALHSPAIIEVSDIDIGNSGQKPLNLNLTGEDLETLSKYADQVKEQMKKIPGLVDVDTNFRAGKPEFHVLFDRPKSEALGVSTTTAGTELRYRTEGSEAATYRENGIEYKIRVRFAEMYRDLRQQFLTTLVPNSNNNMIPLQRVAEPEQTTGYSRINRQNKNRFIQIAGNLGPTGSLGFITNEIERILHSDLPPPPGVDFRFQGQAEDFKDLMNNMMIAMGLGIIFIYLVLSSLYESFITPFAILLALPLAMCGAMVALFITGKSIDIFSLIGIVLLLGVVAKNSILLVDYSNQLIQGGMARDAALIKACRTRLRPILMTSFALIAGMIPIAIGLNEASAMRTSMGVAIIGGVLSSTILTLVVVPSAFGFIDDFKNGLRTKLIQWTGYKS